MACHETGPGEQLPGRRPDRTVSFRVGADKVAGVSRDGRALHSQCRAADWSVAASDLTAAGEVQEKCSCNAAIAKAQGIGHPKGSI
jgi:hypothetical protein